jgi:hypothetical protein
VSMLSIRKMAVAAMVLAGLIVFAGVAQASAAAPWWHVHISSGHPTKAGNEGTVLVEVANLGDAPAGKLEEPFTVTEKLPTGVTATQMFGEGGGKEIGPLQQYLSQCSLETTTCTFRFPVLPYERLLMKTDVKVAPGSEGGEVEVHVSGGGAPPVTIHQKISLGTGGSYGVESYELQPEEEGGSPDTQAGSHPFQLTTTFAMNQRAMPSLLLGEPVLKEQPFAMTKDLRFKLPPGLIGNPTPLPKCSTAIFTLESSHPELYKCPNDTVVGVAVISIDLASVFHAPTQVSVPLYALEPSAGEPAKFGFNVPPVGIPVILDTSVATGGDYGVVVTVPNIVSVFPFMASQVTFWGVPSDPRHDTARGTCLTQPVEVLFGAPLLSCPGNSGGQPFLIMPTSCEGVPHTTMEADSWSEVGTWMPSADYAFQNSEGEQFSLDGCNRLSFSPSVKVTPDGQEAATPTGLSVDVHVPQDASLNPAGDAESAVRNTTVTLPDGVALNPAGADGLQSCSLAQVGLESPAEPSCPEAAKVGTVEIKTPLLPNPLVGAAYLAQQDANPFGSLVALYVAVKDPVSGVMIKVAGEVKPDPVTGQLVSTFMNTPPLPFEDLVLHFFGGSRAPLGTPALCGSYTTTASIAPWSGNPAADSSSQFQITSGPNHAPCSNPLPFNPSLTTGSLNIQAGAFTPFTMTMSREDGNQNLDAIQLKMPPGLLGEISKVKLCGEAEANAGTCGIESLIGETVVSVGLGGNPYTVKGGRVYITGPYGGAPYGLSIVNPAKAGPFDLGQVVVRAKIEVDPTTSAITIASDSTGPYRIPQMIDGIPLQIKHVNVTINRPEFTFNPTNCEPMQIGGSLTSTEGAVSSLHVPFQVTNCATLAFKPIFSVSTNGKTSRAKGASLHVKLTYPKAPFGTQANIGKVKVDLPKQLPSRLTTLQKACPDSVFDANPASCPADSRIGSATATTPVLPVHLEGPAYFVSHGGAKFPELIVALSGQGVTVYLHGETFISPAGITSSTFRTIPDVPIGTFELTLPQGPDSALAANGNLCTVKGGLHMPTTFVGANGMSIKQSTPVTATGCPKKKAKNAKKSGKHKKKK